MTLLDYRKTLIAAFLIIFACLGLGRFGFGMVLPNMQESLGISTTQIGFISSANFVGYLLGAFLITPLYNKFETYKLIVFTLVLQGLSMFFMVFFQSYITLSFLYLLSGLFAAVVNLALMAYMANILPKAIRGKALGIVTSGSGLAIISSGFIVPNMESLALDMPWRYSWGIFSIMVILTAFFAIPGLKKHTKHHIDETKTKIKEFLNKSSFWKIAVIYMIFGITYIIYLTFFVSAVMDKYSLDSAISSKFWMLLGFVSIFSGYLFGIIADKFGAFRSLIFVYILQALSQILLAFNFSSEAMWISVLLYGITVFAIPSLVALLTSIYFDIKKTAQVLSLLTLLFAFAQTLGPLLAGIIKDTTGSFDIVFLFSFVLCILAVILSYIFSKEKSA